VRSWCDQRLPLSYARPSPQKLRAERTKPPQRTAAAMSCGSVHRSMLRRLTSALCRRVSPSASHRVFVSWYRADMIAGLNAMLAQDRRDRADGEALCRMDKLKLPPESSDKPS
jgi:hypothetical protein